MERRGADVEGFAVAPSLNQGEMIGVTILLQHVESQIAVILAGSIRLRLDEFDGLILSGREDIDVSEDVYRF